MADTTDTMNLLVANSPQGYEVARALVLDLDGTVRLSRGGHRFIQDAADVVVREGAATKLWRYRQDGWHVIAVSNQGGVACGFKTVEQMEAEFNETNRQLRGVFHFAYHCVSHPEGVVEYLSHVSLLRKPYYGMLVLAEVDALTRANTIIDWPNSLFVGDRDEDRECAVAAGLSFLTADEFFARKDEAYNIGDYLETKEGMVYRIIEQQGDELTVEVTGAPEEVEQAFDPPYGITGTQYAMATHDAARHRLHAKEDWEEAYPDTNDVETEEDEEE